MPRTQKFSAAVHPNKRYIETLYEDLGPQHYITLCTITLHKRSQCRSPNTVKIPATTRGNDTTVDSLYSARSRCDIKRRFPPTTICTMSSIFSSFVRESLAVECKAGVESFGRRGGTVITQIGHEGRRPGTPGVDRRLAM